MPSLGFILPHWLYWSGLIFFPLIAAWLTRRQMKDPPDGRPTYAITYLFWALAGGVFWGDYAGLDAATNANPLWSDTRNPDLFACRDASGNVTTPPNVCTGQSNGTPLNDQDVYDANVSIPNPG